LLIFELYFSIAFFDSYISYRRARQVDTRKLFVVSNLLLFTFIASIYADDQLDRQLIKELQRAGFTGRVESTLTTRLGRPINKKLANLGRLLFFDNILGLHTDNSCAGCHSPAFSFGDSQSIAIGVDNNGIVGPHRKGPRNQRKAPPVTNSAFFPKLMLNSRFIARSGDPFDNSQGFKFPLPEGVKQFPANDPHVKHLLSAQGHIPETELVEMAGFSGTKGTIGTDFDQFDNGKGIALPPADANGFRNDAIRQVVLARVNDVPQYRKLFGEVFNKGEPMKKGGIQFRMIGQALGEFQISLTFADAPIDQFAKGDMSSMTDSQKRGALLFFGEAKCVQCHAVAGSSNEMFSDFENHVLGVPQIAPDFGIGKGNVLFDGKNSDEDFGSEQITKKSEDRFKFRSSPLRNVALQPAFFHNGAFTRLEDAISHHLNVLQSNRNYDPAVAGVDQDLCLRKGPSNAMLSRLDPLIKEPIQLRQQDFDDLVEFVRVGLLDPRALPANLCQMIPERVPSGIKVIKFEGCQ
jgi:cytochrome c peroxidase